MNKTGKTEASYRLREYKDGTMSAITFTRWYRSFGKCNLQYFHRNGEIFTQSRFRAWLKKYGLNVRDEVVEKLPKSI